MPDSNPGLMTLFTEALERSDPAERSAYLDRACRGDADLRRRVEELLAAHPGIGRFLDPDRTSVREPTPRDTTCAFVPVDHGTVNLPRGDSATGAFVLSGDETVNRPSDNLVTGTFGSDAHRSKSLATGAPDPNATKDTSGNAPPRRDRASGGESGIVIAGRYTLVNVIGEGGMGSVYLATQSEPVRRQVALKLIKAGMDSRAVLARFDAERQALALMDHPNIARVYDGGTTEKGQPFFVMELVKGVTLTEYCDTQSTRARMCTPWG